MWTLTFKDAISPNLATKAWKNFTLRLLRRNPDLGGVRVYELHPGWKEGQEERSHGLHIHMITDQYLDVNVMRGLALGLFGRIHVVEAKDLTDPGKLAGYLSKYVSKSFGARDGCMKKMRLWSAFGTLKPAYTKVKDVSAETGLTVFIKRVRQLYSKGYHSFTYVLGLTAKNNELFEMLSERDACKITKRRNAIFFRFLREVTDLYANLTPVMSYRLDTYFKTSSLHIFY